MTSDTESLVSTAGKLPKLLDDNITNNYGKWKIESEVELLRWDLLDYVTGPLSQPPDIPPPHKASTKRGFETETGSVERVFIIRSNLEERIKKIKAAKPWMKKNNVALSKIFKAVSGSNSIHLIKGVRHASTAWEILRKHYQPQNSALANSKRGNMQSYICMTDMDVGEWLTEIKRRYNVLFNIDPDALSDHDFALNIINNLPQCSPEWWAFAKGLRQRFSHYKHMTPPQPITLHEVIDDIQEELYFDAEDHPDASTHVFATQSTDKKSGKHSRQPDTSSSDPAPKRACTSTSSPSSSKHCSNINCGCNSHEISGCFTIGGG
jgi:hypothetical protein